MSLVQTEIGPTWFDTCKKLVYSSFFSLFQQMPIKESSFYVILKVDFSSVIPLLEFLPEQLNLFDCCPRNTVLFIFYSNFSIITQN